MPSTRKFGARPVLVTQRAEDFETEHLRLPAIELDGASAAFSGRAPDSNPHTHGTVDHTAWSKAFCDARDGLGCQSEAGAIQEDVPK